MSDDAYNTIQRMLGNIEGAASAIDNEDVKDTIYNALETLDSVINKIWEATHDGR